MKRLFAVALLLSTTLAAGAQETSDEMYGFLAARLAAERGEFSRALDLIDELIGKNPADPVLRFERAEIYASAAKLDKAIAELREVVKLSPTFYEAHRLLGRILIDTSGGDRKKVDDALVFLEAAYRLQPSDLGTGLAIVQIHLAAGRSGDAERVLGELAEASPDNRTVNYQYSQVLMKAGKTAEAKPYLERVVASDPLFGPAVFQLVDLYQANRDWILAADTLGPVVAADPRNLELRRRQAYFYLEGGQSGTAVSLLEGLLALDPRDDRSRYLYGEALSAMAQYEKANQQYRTLLKGKPNDPELLISIGSNQIALGEFDDARKTFEVMSTLPSLTNQGKGIAKTQLAAIDHQLGKYTEALAAARKVLDDVDVPNYQAVSIALDVFRRENRLEDAASFLDGLIAKFPEDSLLQVRQLEYYVRAGRADDAARRVKELQAAGPRGTLSASQAYAAAEDYKGAIAILEAQRKAAPDEIDVLFQLGAMYERDGAIEKSEAAFLEILEKQPDHSATLNYLGYMWADRNVNLSRAETMLEKAVSMQPRNGAYVDSLGWVYFRLGKLDLAKKHLEDATLLVPRDPTIRHHLADVYAKLGMTDEALVEYKKARDYEPEDDSEAKAIAEKIALLEAEPGRK
ncbi:MAG: tetratricopeptide repeat protein [Thermoanaerobaculia bacterium]|nr:tetratricopeptide repeat protein [Thermoanaerobaculia bacterium]